MWFDQRKIDALEQALKTGQKAGLESILHELAATNTNPTQPTFCPRCGKTFVRRSLAYLRTIVPSCPEGHGVWLKEETAHKIKRFFDNDQSTAAGIRNRQVSLRVFAIMVGIAVAVFNLNERTEVAHKPAHRNYKATFSMEHLKNVSPKYWPTRDYSQWNVFPATQNVITDPAELEYFHQWMEVANEGIINRLNMQDALLAQRPADEYIDVFHFYADRQSAVISWLQDIIPPERLEVFHQHVIEAVIEQIAFYEDYAGRKGDDPRLEFNQLLQHPKLRACDQKLWAAFHEFERVYPRRDTATNNAIEQRLCWLDLI